MSRTKKLTCGECGAFIGLCHETDSGLEMPHFPENSCCQTAYRNMVKSWNYEFSSSGRSKKSQAFRPTMAEMRQAALAISHSNDMTLQETVKTKNRKKAVEVKRQIAFRLWEMNARFDDIAVVLEVTPKYAQRLCSQARKRIHK